MQLISLKRPNESFRQENAIRVKSPVFYVPEPIALLPVLFLLNLKSMWPVLKANYQLYRQDPQRYRRAWRICADMKNLKAKKRFLAAGVVAKFLKEKGVEHLHAHFANDPATVARFVHALTGIPYSFTAHAKDIFLSPQTVLRDKIHTAKFVVTCTKYNRRYLQNLSRNGTPIHTVYHGLDDGIFSNSNVRRAKERLPAAGIGAPPLILSVGRLVEKKGFDVLLEACQILRKERLLFRCEIIGEGPMAERLSRLLLEFDLKEQVQILKFIPQEKLVKKYPQAKVFALPCQITRNGDRDGIPNVLLEAMAMGLPVVATDVSGISEVVVPFKNGILVPPQNPQALAAAMKEVLTNQQAYRHFITAAKKLVNENFNLTNNVTQLKNLFEENCR